jgi:signal transduction histidine kinase
LDLISNGPGSGYGQDAKDWVSKMFHSIRWRLVLSYLFLVLLILAVVGAVVLRLVEGAAEQQEREYLTANAEAIARQASSLMWPVIRQSELQELAETSSFLGNIQVKILDPDQRVLADSERATEENIAWLLLPQRWQFQVPQGVPEALLFGIPRAARLIVPASLEEQARMAERLPSEAVLTLLRWQKRVWGGGFELDIVQSPDQLRDLAVSVQAVPRSEQVVMAPIDESVDPVGYVEVSNGPDFVTEPVATTRRAFAYAAVGAMCLAVIVGLVVSRGLTAPLRDLIRVADRMSGGDLSTRAPVRGKDEIGQLGGQFNTMAGRLEASFAELAAERDALRRFIADASHELRTPITALRSFNDLLQGAAAEDASARAEFLAESEVQLDRLEWVTRHLLDLSRLEAGLVPLDLAEHGAGDLIESVASAFKSLARERGIALTTRTPAPSVKLRCDRARIELALSDLLENALKFTPSGGEVEIGAERAADAVSLWVEDSGPGIHPDDLPHIFERFYRGESTAAGGTGLGLAIVQSVIQAHDGHLSVHSELGEGSLFTIELPLVQ